MTDRIHSITLVLAEDTRTDDAEGLLHAVQQLQGVISAAGNVSDLNTYVAEQRAVNDLRQKLLDVLWPKK